MPNISSVIKSTQDILKNIIPLIVIAVSLFVIIFLAIKNKYEYMLAFSGIIFGLLTPYFSKNVEIEKSKQQFIFERKQTAYSNLMSSLIEYRANLASMQGTLLLLLKNNFDEENKRILLKEIDDTFQINFEKFKKVNSNIANNYTLFTEELLEFTSANLNKKAIELNDVYQKLIDEIIGKNQEFTEERYNLIDKISNEMNQIIGKIITIIRKDTGV
jgi:hypothetical protein